MLGVVPPVARFTEEFDGDLKSFKTDRDWGSNVRTTVLCPTRQRAPGTA